MKNLTILVVEDHGLAQHMLRLFLLPYAADCRCVETAEAALTAVSECSYDLLVINLGLPDHNGFELADRLRRQGVASVLLGLTSQLDPSYQQEPRWALFTGVLEKPLTENCRIKGQRFDQFMQGLLK